MPLFLRNYSLVEITYLLIRLNKNKFVLGNTKDADRQCRNEQKHTQTHTHARTYTQHTLTHTHTNINNYFGTIKKSPSKRRRIPIIS